MKIKNDFLIVHSFIKLNYTSEYQGKKCVHHTLVLFTHHHVIIYHLSILCVDHGFNAIYESNQFCLRDTCQLFKIYSNEYIFIYHPRFNQVKSDANEIILFCLRDIIMNGYYNGQLTCS